MSCRSLKPRRRGAMAVLTAFLLIILLAMVAFAVDIGYVLVAQTDLQRAADAAAHAAVLEYRSDDSPYLKAIRARRAAREYVEANEIINSTATVSMNYLNVDPDGDILLGRIDFSQPGQPMTFDNYDEYNAARVRVRRTASKNGALKLFFARALGRESVELEAQATAAIVHNVGGFKAPPSGENVPLLPITIQVDFWYRQLGVNNDNWAFDSPSQTVSEEPDGVPEVVLFPHRTESSGNFGALNIGVTNNSASYLGNQIRHGLSQSDLDYHGGEIALDEYGELALTGDPGISASIKDDLDAIVGKPIVIPLYREVVDNGNNAVFTIVKFVGVRIMSVQLTSGDKYVSVQPANVTFKGVVQTDAGLVDTSERVYSPPLIVQ